MFCERMSRDLCPKGEPHHHHHLKYIGKLKCSKPNVILQVKVQHKDNLRLFEAQHCDLSRTFGIQHYAGRVVYDTTDFLGEDEDDDDN